MKPRIWWNRTLGHWCCIHGQLILPGPHKQSSLGEWLESLRALPWDETPEPTP